MTKRQAVQALSRITTEDPEAAHAEAEEILLAYAGPEIETAYRSLIARSRWWASA